MDLKKFAVRGIVVLAVFVALCMFFSGTIRTITTPKVKLTSGRRGKLEERTELTGKLAFQILLAIVLAVLGAASAWAIQSGMYRLHLRFRLPVVLSVLLSLAWLGLGIWCGQWVIGLLCVLVQLLAGLMAAYGGRRSELGRQNASLILGLRHYFKTVDREDLKRIQENDPEYFYNLLPFALAMGVEYPFAKRFGSQKLAPCPYFTCGISKKLTAEEWTDFFRETAQILDERYRRMEIEKYAAIWIRR